jgi:hypothetical protein
MFVAFRSNLRAIMMFCARLAIWALDGLKPFGAKIKYGVTLSAGRPDERIGAAAYDC